MAERKSDEKDEAESLRRLLEKMRSDWSDVTFVVEGERFPANRSVLATNSPVLAKMLSNGMKESGQDEIVLEQLSSDVWRVVLHFCYTRKLKDSDFNRALAVLECAHRFQMDELEGEVELKIIRGLNYANCVAAYAISDMLQLEKLSTAAINSVKKDFNYLPCIKDVALLKLDSLLPILKSRDLVVDSELDVLLTIAVYLYFRDESNLCEETMSQVDDFPKENEGEVARIAERLLSFTKITPQSISKRLNVSDSRTADMLLECVDVKNMCTLERQVAARLSRALKFDKLYKKCCDFPDRPQFRLSCPLDFWERSPHPRYSSRCTFTYRFRNIANIVDSNTPLNRKDGTWIHDNLGRCKWKPRVSCTRDSSCIALEVFVEPTSCENETTTVLVDIFVMYGDQSGRAIGSKHLGGPRNLRDLRNGLGSMFSEGIIFGETYSLTVGTTLYFLD